MERKAGVSVCRIGIVLSTRQFAIYIGKAWASSDERRAAVSAYVVRQMLDSTFLPSQTQRLCGF